MLSKTLSRMFSTATAPNVWINKHTKVICQGMTGSQVPPTSPREPTRRSRH
jgi:succinyl-CoA synthetase alpha subunit